MSNTLDRALFIKVCGLLTSSHDGEVVNAARRANAMLKAAGMTWEEALASENQSRPRKFQPSTPSDRWDVFASRYPREADWIYTRMGFNVFALSLYEGVLHYGSLTTRQLAAVQRNLNR